MFGSVDKTFGCCRKIFGCSNKNFYLLSLILLPQQEYFFPVILSIKHACATNTDKEYLNLPPPIFLKLSKRLRKDTQAQNLLPDCIFSTLKTALKIKQKCKITKTGQFLGNGWKYGEILKMSV